MERLPAGAGLMDDRNFGVFSVAWAAQQKGYGVLSRMTRHGRARSPGGFCHPPVASAAWNGCPVGTILTQMAVYRKYFTSQSMYGFLSRGPEQVRAGPLLRRNWTRAVGERPNELLICDFQSSRLFPTS